MSELKWAREVVAWRGGEKEGGAWVGEGGGGEEGGWLVHC